MKKIEVNTHSERIELECDIGQKVIKHLYKNKYLEKINLLTTDGNDNVIYTELGQDIFNDIVDVISKYIKVKEE
jgi:hypothetical protein